MKRIDTRSGDTGTARCTIRNFRLEDLQRVLEIEERSFGVDAYDMVTFLQLHRLCGDLFLVAELEGRVVGYSVTCIEYSSGGIVAHVHSIAVDPECRGKGVGGMLMEETFRRLRERGVRDVVLEVSTANETGLSFWRKLGFTPVGVKKKFYLDGSDAIIMRRRI